MIAPAAAELRYDLFFESMKEISPPFLVGACVRVWG
jgi:hypothetical protein